MSNTEDLQSRLQQGQTIVAQLRTEFRQAVIQIEQTKHHLQQLQANLEAFHLPSYQKVSSEGREP